MGYAYGIDERGREVGYGVVDVCNLDGCEAVIDRGMAYRCAGCDNFFCYDHLTVGNLCPMCTDLLAPGEGTG